MNIITEKSLLLLRKEFNDIEGLYRDRCVEKNGELKPHFWEPPKPRKDPFSLWGTDDLMVKEEWNIDKLMSRLIAIGLNLELPVADFIQSGIKRDLPSDNKPLTTLLLRSNAADEARHYKGFQGLKSIYGVDQEDLEEANRITSVWESHMSIEYPLMISQLIEIGAFLIELGLMRLFGGKYVSEIAYGISTDEIRHVATARTVCSKLGYGPSKPSRRLTNTLNETLDFMLEPLTNIEAKDELGLNPNKDFLLKCSKEFVERGFSREFNNLVTYFESSSLLEMRNDYYNDREVFTGDLDTLLAEMA